MSKQADLKIIKDRVATKEYGKIWDALGKDSQLLLLDKVVFEYNSLLDKELDIVHKYLTKFYNHDDNKIGDVVRECLAEIDKIKNKNTTS